MRMIIDYYIDFIIYLIITTLNSIFIFQNCENYDLLEF